jgi:type IV pilus assembly protein PilA
MHCKLLYNKRDNITRFIGPNRECGKMRQLLKNKLKDQKGLTLIELLAVIVILGIIAAIAVPSILGLIDNTKKDAHVANAQQMISSAKMAITSDVNLQATGTRYLTLEQLVALNYIDEIESPDTGHAYIDTIASVTDTAVVSYVKITDGKVVGVKLVTDQRGVQTSGKGPVSQANLKRGVVIAN